MGCEDLLVKMRFFIRELIGYSESFGYLGIYFF